MGLNERHSGRELTRDGEGGLALDTLLSSYASGKLSRALHVLVESHLELVPSGRHFTNVLETSIADSISVTDAPPLPIMDRNSRLESVFAHEPLSAVPSETRSGRDDFPSALRRYTGKNLEDIKWRWRMPGLKEYTIETNDGLEASLLWIRAGRKMPSHTHDGAETTLVLKGSFGDVNGHFYRGDVAIADADVDHSPRAGAREDCICFVVTDAPLRLTGWFSRIFNRH